MSERGTKDNCVEIENIKRRSAQLIFVSYISWVNSPNPILWLLIKPLQKSAATAASAAVPFCLRMSLKTIKEYY